MAARRNDGLKHRLKSVPPVISQLTAQERFRRFRRPVRSRLLYHRGDREGARTAPTTQAAKRPCQGHKRESSDGVRLMVAVGLTPLSRRVFIPSSQASLASPDRGSQPSRRFFPQYCPSGTRGGSLPVAPAGTKMGRMTNHFLLARDGLPLKMTKRTQGLQSWCARGGRMTHRFLARDGLPPKITKRTQGLQSWCAPGAGSRADRSTESPKLL
jgi:hypothetical protein